MASSPESVPTATQTADQHLLYLKSPRGDSYLRGVAYIHEHGNVLMNVSSIWGVTGRTYDFGPPRRMDIVRRQEVSRVISSSMSDLYCKHQPSSLDAGTGLLLGAMNGVTGLASLIMGYRGGVDGHSKADKRVLVDMSSENNPSSSWLCKLLQDTEHSVSYYIWSLMQMEGVRCVHDDFVKLLRSYIKHHGMFAMSMLTMMGRPRAKLYHKLAIDVTLVVEGINCGLEAINVVDTRCLQSAFHCSCKSFTNDNDESVTEGEVVHGSLKRRKI